MSTYTYKNLFSKNHAHVKNCTPINKGTEKYKQASDVMNIDLYNIPYGLFTKNYAIMSKEENNEVSKYFGNVMHILDANDRCDNKGLIYLAELFAFQCSGAILGKETQGALEDIKALQKIEVVGLAYEISGCND